MCGIHFRFLGVDVELLLTSSLWQIPPLEYVPIKLLHDIQSEIYGHVSNKYVLPKSYTMENGPLEDVLPIEHSDVPLLC